MTRGRVLAVEEVHHRVDLPAHLDLHRVGAPTLVGATRLLDRRPLPLRPPPPRADQVRSLQNPIDRRWTQERHVLVDHPPGQFTVTRGRVLAGVRQDGQLLLGEGLVRRDGPGRLGGPGLRPGLLLEPTVIAATSDPQRRQRPRRRPTAPLPGLLDFLMDALLQLGRELSVVSQPWRRFFSSWFSAVISAITPLKRTTSSSRRSRWASGRPRLSSRTRSADPSSCFFQA